MFGELAALMTQEVATRRAREEARMSRSRPHGMSSVSMPTVVPTTEVCGMSMDTIIAFREYYLMKGGSMPPTMDGMVEAFEGLASDQSDKIKSLEIQNTVLQDMVKKLLDEKTSPPIVVYDDKLLS